MTALVFVDSNVFVHHRDSSDPVKQAVASRWLAHLWRNGTGRTSCQALNEFYVVATRKLGLHLSAADAWDDVTSLFRWDPLPLSAEVLTRSRDVQSLHRLSWGDSLSVAAAQLQNCGDLAAGSSRDKVIEVHGNVHAAVCLGCGWKGAMQAVLARVRAGEDDPPCESCGGILKSDTISFGQALVPEVIGRALQVAGEADLLLAVGTTLRVYPVANAVPLAREAGARVVIVNAQPTPFDDLADAVIRAPIAEALPVLCG